MLDSRVYSDSDVDLEQRVWRWRSRDLGFLVSIFN